MNKIARIKEPKRLPAVLSPQEVKSIFDVTENLKHKVILMTIYSAGLRVSEACNLKILREYWSRYHPTEYLFSGNGRTDSKVHVVFRKCLKNL